MHLLYCDDINFIFDEKRNAYVEGQFPYDVWRRYLKIFDTVTVLGRQRQPAGGTALAGLNRSSGPHVSFVPVQSVSSPLRLVRHYNSVVRGIGQAMTECDAVIVRLPSQNGLIASRVARKLGKPWAAEVVACPWDQLWNFGTWQGKVLAPIQWLRMRRAVASSQCTLYVTRSFLQRRYPAARGTRTSVSNVDIPEADPQVLEARQKRIKRPRSQLVLGMIGSIRHKYKGIGVAIQALARVQDRLPAFEFRVLGPGDPQPWRDMAQRHGLEARVRFCGVLRSGQPVLDWLDEIDLYLQPSFQEGLPRGLIEAMSRGCPALGSTAGGIPELLPAACLHRPGAASRLGTLVVEAVHDADWQLDQARRNFREAKHYVRGVLEAERTSFWRRFAVHAEGSRSDQCEQSAFHQHLERDTAVQK